MSDLAATRLADPVRRRSGMAVRTVSAFTLLELIMAILIMAILIGVLLPTTSLIRRAGKKRQAAAEAKSLVLAVKSYRSVYGRWPNQAQDGRDITYGDEADGHPNQSAVIDALLNNPRQLTFVQVPERRLRDGLYVDPWESPYLIAMDENGDGYVQVGSTNQAAPDQPLVVSIRESVAVASWGGRPTDTAGRVYSWEE